MASNRFDTSQQQQYTSQYVPLPFEAISALGEKANKNFAEGEKAVDDLGVLGAAIKAAPMHQEDRATFINEYNKRTKALIDEAKGDYGSADFKRKVNTLTNEFKNDPKVQAFAGTLEAYKLYEKRKSEKGAERDLDYTYEKNPDGSFKQVDVLQKGKYNTKFTKYDDWNEAGKKVMGKIAEDSVVKELDLDLGRTKINNGETEVWSRKTGKYEGVNRGKLQGLSKMMVGEYANTDAGKHHLQSLIGQDIDYLQLNNLAQSGNEQAIKTKEAIDKEFENHLYRSNANQIGMKTETTYDDQFVTNRAKQKANDAIEEGLKRVPSDVINYAQGNPADLNNAVPAQWKNLFNFNEKGEVILSDHSNSKNTYIGKNNQVYDISTIPLKNTFTATPGMSKLLTKDGYVIFKDGVEIDRVAKQQGLNTQLLKEKQDAANDYLRSTGQLEEYKKKYPKAADMRDAALRDMALGVRSGTHSNQAVPIFSEETNQVLTKRLLPTSNEKGDVVTAGLVGNITVVDEAGKAIPYSEEEKVGMLVNAKVTGGSFIGGDVIKVTKADGTVANLKLNMPALNQKNKNVVTFIQNTNKNVMQPPSLKEQQERNKKVISTYTSKIKEVQESNSDPRIKSLKVDDLNKVVKTIANLEKQGFTESSKFDMSNGDTAYSFVNYKVVGHPTQCMVVHSNGEISFTNISSIGAEEFQNTFSSSIQNASTKEETKNEFTTIVQ